MSPYRVERRSVRAPRDDRTTLVQPPLGSIAELLAKNQYLRGSEYSRVDILGQSLLELSEQARDDLLRHSVDHTRSYRDVTGASAKRSNGPLILTGHQPQLFHAGVWFKNFVLDALRESLQGVAIHLQIDNDLARGPSIYVPAKVAGKPVVLSVPYDKPREAIPHEERRIADWETFASFSRNLHYAARGYIHQPILDSLWPTAISAAKASGTLGMSLAQARHKLEEAHGLNTLELPLSGACDTRSFHRFVLHLFRNIRRFQDIHNDALAQYRDVHRIRSKLHPVPDLAVNGQWREAPFWIWSTDEPNRRAVYILDGPETLTVRAGPREAEAGATAEAPLQFQLAADCELALEQLDSVRRQGIKIRPRALITTMYLRLALSDLFIHGIGGAKYDQVTDVLIDRFFGLEPPRFVTATGTFLLPCRSVDVTSDLREVDRQLRDQWYHPERYLPKNPASRGAELVARKNQWIGRQLSRGQRRERHRAIEEINDQLRTISGNLRHQLQHEKERLMEAKRAGEVLNSREYSFCLFPAESLIQSLRELSSA